MSRDAIESVSAMTIRARLPSPIVFGDWVIREREFALVRVRSKAGAIGVAYTLTRDGAVVEQIRKTIAATYVGSAVGEQAETFKLAWRRSLASHVAGIGLRALSIVDLACWDLAARREGKSIARYLGGANLPMPATAIVGYPPTMAADETHDQVADLYARGWRRFKLPIAATVSQSSERLRATRLAAPNAWIGIDAAWTFNDVDTAASFAEPLADIHLGWFEDVFPPGDAGILRRLRDRVSVPIAQGDEQGGAYFPEALIALRAVDVIRIDLTCMGGITRAAALIQQIVDAGLAFAPHMFPHVHSQVLSGLGFGEIPIEWGVPDTGVHPMDDSLLQPRLLPDGRMEPLPDHHGFGQLASADWIMDQPHDDPDGVLESL